MSERDVFDQLFAPAASDPRFSGVAVAVVSNIKDPEGLGRVRLRLPWLSDDLESAWARVSAPMAGPGRGVYLLPEVDDEVLVAFEHGNPQRPYVLGGLWSDADRPPVRNDDGSNDVRLIRSRSGHVIRFDDSDGAERIEIVDGSGRNRIVIDTRNDAVTVSARGDVTVESRSGKVSLRGQDVVIEAERTLSLTARAGAELSTDARLTLKGAITEIN